MRISGFQAVWAGLALAWAIVLAVPAFATVEEAAAVPGAATGTGSGQPAELPPASFAGAQFIDSAGCVFVREGGRWQSRVARDGSAVCGYPPTLSARWTAPDSAPALVPPKPESPRQRMTRALTEAIVPALHAGELAPQEAPAVAAAAATTGEGEAPAAEGTDDGRAPAEAQVAERRAAAADPLGLDAAMALAPTLASAAAGRRAPESRLCALLGSTPAPTGARPGRATALGLCEADDGTASVLDGASVDGGAVGGAPVEASGVGGSGEAARTAAPQAVRRAETAAASASARPERAAARGRRADAAGKAAAAHPGRTATNAARTGARPGPIEPIIPPGSRFVQIGSFGDRGNVARNAGRLGRMGLPVAAQRSHDGRTTAVLAGPFDDRGDLVRAVNQLRKAGYRDAFAR